jgi:hypothetical protein
MKLLNHTIGKRRSCKKIRRLNPQTNVADIDLAKDWASLPLQVMSSNQGDFD